jgi:IS30 family transposase
MAKERTSVRMQAQIKILSEQGHSIRSIARILRLSRRTVSEGRGENPDRLLLWARLRSGNRLAFPPISRSAYRIRQIAVQLGRVKENQPWPLWVRMKGR